MGQALYVSIAYIIAQIWSGPPYNLTPAGNGYFFVGGLLGGIIGGVPGAYLVDIVTNFLTKRNNGTYEPEFRIPVQILSVILYGVGWFTWMWTVDHPWSKGYFLGSFCQGCICTGITIATVSANLYILWVNVSYFALSIFIVTLFGYCFGTDMIRRDSFPADATEIFILQMTAKNLLFYGFSTFINSWAAEDGPGAVFKTCGIVALCLSATSIAMCKYLVLQCHSWPTHNMNTLMRALVNRELTRSWCDYRYFRQGSTQNSQSAEVAGTNWSYPICFQRNAWSQRRTLRNKRLKRACGVKSSSLRRCYIDVLK